MRSTGIDRVRMDASASLMRPKARSRSTPRCSIPASLAFVLTGDMALRARGGDRPSFCWRSAAGIPAFPRPPGFLCCRGWRSHCRAARTRGYGSKLRRADVQHGAVRRPRRFLFRRHRFGSKGISASTRCSSSPRSPLSPTERECRGACRRRHSSLAVTSTMTLSGPTPWHVGAMRRSRCLASSRR